MFDARRVRAHAAARAGSVGQAEAAVRRRAAPAKSKARRAVVNTTPLYSDSVTKNGNVSNRLANDAPIPISTKRLGRAQQRSVDTEVKRAR